MKHSPRLSSLQLFCQCRLPSPGLLLGTTLALLAPASFHAQTLAFTGATSSVNFGSANLCKPGQAKPAPCSKTMTLDYKVTSGGTLGTPKVPTMGAPDLDFTLANGTTCTGGVTVGETCAVNVTFAPRFAGASAGAVQIVAASGKVLAMTPIWGTGNGPQIGALADGLVTYRGFDNPAGEPGATVPATIQPAVDGAGNVYLAFAYGPESGAVYELPAGGGPQVKLPFDFTGTLGPMGGCPCFSPIAVDGAGDLFVASALSTSPQQGVVLELPAGGGPQITLPLGNLPLLNEFAVDGAGDLFVQDPGPPAGPSRILKLPYGCQSPSCVVTVSRHGSILGMAVDVVGDLFLTYSGGGSNPTYISAIEPANGGPELVLSKGEPVVDGVFDGLGDLLSIDETSDNGYDPFYTLYTVEYPAGSATQVPLVTFAAYYYSDAGDPTFAFTANSTGDVFITENYGDPEPYLVTAYRSQFTPLDFGSIPLGSNRTLPLAVTNIGNRNLIISPHFESPSYKIVSQNPAYCLGGTLPGRTCNVNIQFTALSAGPHTITLNLGSNGAGDANVLLQGIGMK